jgi:hypothetical protein
MPEIRWSNGAVDKAASWEELLARVNRLPWNRDLSPDEFRAVMATRAYRWSGVKVDPDPEIPAAQFIRDLAFAKLVEIIDYDEPKDPTA